MNMENEIQKLHELLDDREEDLFRSLLVQLSIKLGEDRYMLLGLVFHATDVMTWNFAADCMEVDVLGNKGIYTKDDSLHHIDDADTMCFGRAGLWYSCELETVTNKYGSIQLTDLLLYGNPDTCVERYSYGERNFAEFD